MQSDGGGGVADGGHYFFFSAPASPVHYILHSPPSSTAPSAPSDGDYCAGAGAGDFEFFAARAGGGGGMSSAEDLFVAGRIRVGGGLSPIRQEEGQDSGDNEEAGGDGRATRLRRTRSASPPRSNPRATQPSPRPFPSASSSSSSSSTSSSSSSAKNTRRRISLRELLSDSTGGGDPGAAEQGGPDDTACGAGVSRSGFWPPSIWPSRSKTKVPLPSPAPRPARRSTSSDRTAAPAKKKMPGGSARRTTSLPYRQSLVLGCLGFGARSYGLAKSMHPLYSR